MFYCIYKIEHCNTPLQEFLLFCYYMADIQFHTQLGYDPQSYPAQIQARLAEF